LVVRIYVYAFVDVCTDEYVYIERQSVTFTEFTIRRPARTYKPARYSLIEA
jgi:hypothetical protein